MQYRYNPERCILSRDVYSELYPAEFCNRDEEDDGGKSLK
jgi:hypothetical protein